VDERLLLRTRLSPVPTFLFVTLGLFIVLAELSAAYTAEPSSGSSSNRLSPSRVAEKTPPSLTQSPVADGIVARYLMDPRGDVEGLLLTDGTQIHVTSRISDELVKAIKPGNHVRVHGSRKQGEVLVQPDVIVNLTDGSSFSVPLRLDLPLPPKEDRLSMTPMKAGGTIQVLLHGNNGEVRGMVLSDGTQVRLPPDVSDEFRRSLRAGENVNVEGYGTENTSGRAIEALSMSADKKPLTPLDPTVRRLP
jgi:hypothetical protein